MLLQNVGKLFLNIFPGAQFLNALETCNKIIHCEGWTSQYGRFFLMSNPFADWRPIDL